MLGLTLLGVAHTAIGLLALVCGVMALLRFKEIRPGEPLGRVYLIATLITAATGLGIFQHGGFGPPHMLSLLTLAALAGGYVASRGVFGRWSRALQATAFSATFLFHLIPGFTETLTRLPPGQPVLPNAEAPAFKTIYGVLLLLFVVGLVLQLRWLRTSPPAAPTATASA